MMDAKRAAAVLMEMEMETFSVDELYARNKFLWVQRGDETAELDGCFTAAQLRAIAEWMDDPNRVTAAAHGVKLP